MDAYTINTLSDLVRTVSDMRTGGYDVEFDIKPNQEKARSGDGFFLIVEVSYSEPGVMVVSPPRVYPSVDGEWWFDADNNVMQVL